jgi:hypothetical protein
MSKQRLQKAFLPLVAAFLISLSPAVAQEDDGPETLDPGPFYGFWQIQEPAGDTCILIVKRGGRLSCFWAGSAARNIEKGEWERTGEKLTARWEAGHVDVFKMLGENAIERSTFEAGKSIDVKPAYTIRGVRIDSRIPGSLTNKVEGPRPVRETIEDSSTRPEIPVNNPFTGYWLVDQSTGIFGIGGGEPNFYLQLSRDGDASVALRDWEGDEGVKGLWRIEGDKAIITWPNNRRDVLVPEDGEGYTLGTYKPKDKLTNKPRQVSAAAKITFSEADRYFEAGEFDRMTVLDIRGTWVPRNTEGKREYISIEGWGNAYRSPAKAGGTGTDPGKWRLESDRVEITWIDGSKDVIRIAFPDFMQDSFGPDEPVTGTPSRSIPVIRTANED